MADCMLQFFRSLWVRMVPNGPRSAKMVSDGFTWPPPRFSLSEMCHGRPSSRLCPWPNLSDQMRCGVCELVWPFGVGQIDMHTPPPPRAPHHHPHRFTSKHFEHLPIAYGHPFQYHHKWQNCREEGAGWWDVEERVIFTTFRGTTRWARILNPPCTPFGHHRPWMHPRKKFQGNRARFWLS